MSKNREAHLFGVRMRSQDMLLEVRELRKQVKQSGLGQQAEEDLNQVTLGLRRLSGRSASQILLDREGVRELQKQA
jgi:hypothetical protein